MDNGKLIVILRVDKITIDKTIISTIALVFNNILPQPTSVVRVK